MLRLISFVVYVESENNRPISLELPDIWLWELIDEFVYQFQAFSQYKLRPKKTVEEIDLLRDKGNFNRVWNVLSVLNVLHSLIDVSNIKKQLEVSVMAREVTEIHFLPKKKVPKLITYILLRYRRAAETRIQLPEISVDIHCTKCWDSSHWSDCCVCIRYSATTIKRWKR